MIKISEDTFDHMKNIKNSLTKLLLNFYIVYSGASLERLRLLLL